MLNRGALKSAIGLKRQFSFNRLHNHWQIRKDFKKEMSTHNEYFQRKFMRWDQKWKDYITKHPFKTGFFCGFIFITHYFKLYQTVSMWWFNRENLRKKFRRWILGNPPND
jgi:hypothetical protein